MALNHNAVMEACYSQRIHVTRSDGEYRLVPMELVSSRDHGEAVAYYTDDKDDAVLTAASMRREMNRK